MPCAYHLGGLERRAAALALGRAQRELEDVLVRPHVPQPVGRHHERHVVELRREGPNMPYTSAGAHMPMRTRACVRTRARAYVRHASRAHLRHELKEVDARDRGLPRGAVVLHVVVAERARHAELLRAVGIRLGHDQRGRPVASRGLEAHANVVELGHQLLAV